MLDVLTQHIPSSLRNRTVYQPKYTVAPVAGKYR